MNATGECKPTRSMRPWAAKTRSALAILGLGAVLVALPVGWGRDDAAPRAIWLSAAASDDGGSGPVRAKADGGDASSGGRADRGRAARRGRADAGVTLAQFTTGFSKRLPANQIEIHLDPNQAVSFFTELVGMQGHTVTHRWTYGGVVVHQSSSLINGPKWRFWSTQILPVDKPGIWRVEVVDDENRVLQSHKLEYRPAG
ncbi:MAG: DUF2914 domain-containing protein [Rhodospirillales bacterium]|nr:MAG: DUF2914 domain-containing protein [Rhodospirillales bacterium]